MKILYLFLNYIFIFHQYGKIVVILLFHLFENKNFEKYLKWQKFKIFNDEYLK